MEYPDPMTIQGPGRCPKCGGAAEITAIRYYGECSSCYHGHTHLSGFQKAMRQVARRSARTMSRQEWHGANQLLRFYRRYGMPERYEALELTLPRGK